MSTTPGGGAAEYSGKLSIHDVVYFMPLTQYHNLITSYRYFNGFSTRGEFGSLASMTSFVFKNYRIVHIKITCKGAGLTRGCIILLHVSNYDLHVITPRACARGKAIGLARKSPDLAF